MSFDVKIGFKRILLFLLLTISFFLTAIGAYLHICHIVEADFVLPNLSFENSDQENLLVDFSDKSIALILHPSLPLFHLKANSCKILLCSLFHRSPLNQGVFVFRC